MVLIPTYYQMIHKNNAQGYLPKHFSTIEWYLKNKITAQQ